jgi:hypothetical protein
MAKGCGAALLSKAHAAPRADSRACIEMTAFNSGDEFANML